MKTSALYAATMRVIQLPKRSWAFNNQTNAQKPIANARLPSTLRRITLFLRTQPLSTAARPKLTSEMHLISFSPTRKSSVDAQLTNVLYSKMTAPHLLPTVTQFGFKAASWRWDPTKREDLAQVSAWFAQANNNRYNRRSRSARLTSAREPWLTYSIPIPSQLPSHGSIP